MRRVLRFEDLGCSVIGDIANYRKGRPCLSSRVPY